MSTRSESTLESVVAAILGISIYIGYSLGVSAAILLICGAGLVAAVIAGRCFPKWWKSWALCPHKVAGGQARKRCELCNREQEKFEETDRREREREGRRIKIDADASRLHDQEQARLANSVVPNLEELRQLTWQQFEDEIARMFERFGYAVKQTPYVNDHGRDAILTKNGDTFLLECKKYCDGGLSGRPDLQKFHSAIITDRAKFGFFVTSGAFTKEAIEFSATAPIELIDGSKLVRFMFDSKPATPDDDKYRSMCRECGDIVHHHLRLARPVKCRGGHEIIPTLDLESVLTRSGAAPICGCGAPMRLVHRKKRRFWGCTHYPRCRRTRPSRPHAPARTYEDSDVSKVIIGCPNCPQQLGVPASKSGTIECPTCTHSFRVQT